eukprot:TRINITY_DN54911_c0_g1_i1.p1 TRINITY_DN54911_c0_g1~~TRINITY_DN54911_c0_g1_i1.p1  ORF type:complete len:467 (-),score=103.13 TRINITY_DN54911_c0_g1_i1:67-1401(-)
MAPVGAVVGTVAGDKQCRGYIDGCFDIMHSGHFNAIRQAKALCSTLVVGVHSDEEIAENKALPVMRQEERYALLDHIKWIDEIVYDVPYSPQLATLDRARADFCIHGDDMPVNAQGFCAYDAMAQAGKLRIIKRTEGVSTTDLIGRLLTLSRQQHGPLELGVADQNELGVAACRAKDLEADAASSIGATGGAMAFVEDLAQRYGISFDDVERLRSLAESANDARGAAAFAPAGVLGSGSGSDNLRANAPVQLLTSTRRIAEFATSRQPTKEDVVVYVSGSFDMFHVGHAEFLKDAKALGTFLLVGVYDDNAVSFSKGEHLPVMNVTERVLNVCACKWADEVIIGAPLRVTEDLVKTWGIKVVARGAGHKRTTGQVGASNASDEVPRKLGIRTEVESRWPDLCHETIVERIMRSREAYVKRNLVRAKREDEYYEQKSAQADPVEA